MNYIFPIFTKYGINTQKSSRNSQPPAPHGRVPLAHAALSGRITSRRNRQCLGVKAKLGFGLFIRIDPNGPDIATPRRHKVTLQNQSKLHKLMFLRLSETRGNEKQSQAMVLTRGERCPLQNPLKMPEKLMFLRLSENARKRSAICSHGTSKRNDKTKSC